MKTFHFHPAKLHFYSFSFVCLVEVSIRVNTHNITKGAGDKRGEKGKYSNSREQGHQEICGRGKERKGVHGINKMNTTGVFRKKNRKFEGRGIGVG